MRLFHFICACTLASMLLLCQGCRSARQERDAEGVAAPSPSNEAVASRPREPAGAASSPTPADDSEDARHQLFQAAAMTRDQQTIRRVGRKLKLFDEKNRPTEQYRPFIEQHTRWALGNREFVREVSSPEKAREYVRKH